MKKITILGSTGSIGKQTLEVIEQYPDKFKIVALTSNNNSKLLVNQAIKFKPKIVVVANKKEYKFVKEALNNTNIAVLAGSENILQTVTLPEIDLVVAAIVGFAGLLPVIKAIEAKKNIALANKEALVVAGDLVTKLSLKYNTKINPIDSEHSALAQCLLGEKNTDVEKIYLTASGGPFFGKNTDFLKNVTPQQALKHPNWDMGKKITIDSATLINKGFEVIEAKWLFGISHKNIDVVIHPQSIIHSLVQFKDGSIKAQLGLPDMRTPIIFALSMPKRLKTSYPRFSFSKYQSLNFFDPDFSTFRCLDLAYHAIHKGGNLPCVLNAANETVVNAFLKNQIRFTDIPDLIEKSMDMMYFIKNPDYNDFLQTHQETEKMIQSWI